MLINMEKNPANQSGCLCHKRPDWAPIEDDTVMHWMAIDIAEWEELRQCPDCGTTWLAAWPEESESPPILCRPHPLNSRKLKDINHPETMRPYCVSRIEEHLGEIKERKSSCRKVNCTRNRISGTKYCLEHLIAEKFGRHLACLSETIEDKKKAGREISLPAKK
jgi:hypothetical protein